MSRRLAQPSDSATTANHRSETAGVVVCRGGTVARLHAAGSASGCRKAADLPNEILYLLRIGQPLKIDRWEPRTVLGMVSPSTSIGRPCARAYQGITVSGPRPIPTIPAGFHELTIGR